MGRLWQFVREMRRRRVFRTAAIYIVGAWVLLEVIALAFQSFGIPDSALQYIWLAAIAGFPLALIFGWRYDITSEGIPQDRPGENLIDPEQLAYLRERHLRVDMS